MRTRPPHAASTRYRVGVIRPRCERASAYTRRCSSCDAALRERGREGGGRPARPSRPAAPGSPYVGGRSELVAQRVAGGLGDLADHLDPRRPATDHDEGEQAYRRAASALRARRPGRRPPAACPQLDALISDYTSGATRRHSSWPKSDRPSRRRRSACSSPGRTPRRHRRPVAAAARAFRGRPPRPLPSPPDVRPPLEDRPAARVTNLGGQDRRHPRRQRLEQVEVQGRGRPPGSPRPALRRAAWRLSAPRSPRRSPRPARRRAHRPVLPDRDRRGNSADLERAPLRRA